jgi:hypothetical protein
MTPCHLPGGKAGCGPPPGGVLDEAAAALDRAGQFLSAHLAGAELVTG